MAGSRKSQLVDQWRPEETVRVRDRDRDRDGPQDTRNTSVERGRSPAAAPARRLRGGHDRESKLGEPDLFQSSSSRRAPRHSRSRDRSRARRRSRVRSPSASRLAREEDLYRPARRREPSVDRTSRTQRPRPRPQSPPSTKRLRSLSPSPSRHHSSRTKRRRSRSVERSTSRSRVAGITRRGFDRAFDPRQPPRSDRESRRPSPDTYKPSGRRKSRSADSRYRPEPPRPRRRTRSPERKAALKRDLSPRRKSPPRHKARRATPSPENRRDRVQREKVEPAARREKDNTSRAAKAVRRSESPHSRRPVSTAARERSPRSNRRVPEARSREDPLTKRARSTRRNNSRSPPRLTDRSGRERSPQRSTARAERGRRLTPSSRSPDRDRRHSIEDREASRMYSRGGPPRPSRPPIDTRNFSHSPPYMAPNHMSPQAHSPYGNSGGGWNGQPQYGSHQGSPMHGYSPQPYQPGYSPQGAPQSQYYASQPPPTYGGPPPQQQGYPPQSFRGGRGGYRGNSYAPDPRYSGSPPVQATRGRGGHFSNLSWTPATGVRGGRPINESKRNSATQLTPQHQSQSGTADEEVDNPFRPSKDLRVEDETLKENNASPTNAMPPPIKAVSSTSAQAESKISFAIKGKALEKPAATPKVDLLAGKNAISRPSTTTVSSSRSKTDAREDRRSEYRSSDFRSELTYRPEQRSSRREERPEKHPEPPRTAKVIRRRLKARPTLSADFTASDSVYYRKTGNESVVGSGTYGKVYKAIHVYTRDMVALKKIRMEGERDGFPVTAIREIKLLQSLNHDNVVKLQEVMVEKNDCFMVFEYLSHDLTGLLNHPTFQLSQAHKKHLAKQLFEGLDYLHRRGVLHRDIKAANILVSNTGQLKLADFGLARFYAKRQKLDYTNRVITIWYRSPELLLGETKYGPAVDIWSAACVLVEIFTKHAIFPGDGGEINQLDKIYNVLGTPMRAEWPDIVEMQWFELLRPAQKLPSTFADKYRDRVTPEAFELLCAMFLYDPAARPSASDVLEHPYFTTEEPQPARAIELAELEGDWHEFESKALRKERDRVDREARRAARGEAEKRKTDGAPVEGERETKRARGEAEGAETEAQTLVEDAQLQE